MLENVAGERSKTQSPHGHWVGSRQSGREGLLESLHRAQRIGQGARAKLNEKITQHAAERGW